MSESIPEPPEQEPSGQQPPSTQPKKKSAAGSLTFKVSAKGAVSVYGLGRFPVTLYYEQWKRLLGSVEPLQAYLEENKSQLKSKEEA
jgi:hypothetical protein